MGRILTVFICIWLSLSPLFGQRLITRQPIQGFNGSGEILAYSSSRIFLQLNKDGEWPRQIQWVILEEGEPLCAITFNKVGWQYTSSADSCALDWMRLDPNAYRYRLFVVESVPSPSESLPDRVAESLLLSRTPSRPAPEPITPNAASEVKGNPNVQENKTSTTKRSEIDSIPDFAEPSGMVIIPPTPSQPKSKSLKESSVLGNDSTIDRNESKVIAITKVQVTPKVSLDTAASPSVPAIVTTEGKGTKPDDSDLESLTLSRIASPTSVADPSSSDIEETLLIDSNFQDSSASMEETPEYIFTVPDFQPSRRWFGRKKKPSTPSTTNSPVPITTEVSEPAEDLETDPETELPKEDKIPIPSETLVASSNIENDTTVYLQKAPFISVASFETLEYTQQVLQQFTCPGGCLIVRSEKGLYYRIGFYPDPKNIAVDLREIRTKYPDAWLVK